MTKQSEFSDDVEIFKYIPEAHIRSLLEKNVLYFSRINRWPDMMELFLENHVNPELASKRYGSCWTLHRGIRHFVDEGSLQKALASVKLNGLDSMWRSYCPKGGVRIRTTLGKVREVLNNYRKKTRLFIQEGPVFYKHHKDVTIDQVSDLCLSKSPCFYTDEEYRFVITAEDGEANNLDIPIDNVAHFVDEVLVSPPIPNGSCERRVSEEILNYLQSIQNPQFSLAEIQDRKFLDKRKSFLFGGW